MLIDAIGANRAIEAVIEALLMKSLEIDRECAPWRTKFGRDDRGRRARAASRGEPDRKDIPDGPDWKVRAASRDRKARSGRKARAARLDRRASPERPAHRARAASRGHRANCRRSTR